MVRIQSKTLNRLAMIIPMFCLCLFPKILVFAQNETDAIRSKKVTINVSQQSPKSIKDILWMIDDQTTLRHRCIGADLNEKVTFEAKNESVDHVLLRLLGPRGYTFEFSGKTIRIMKKEAIALTGKNTMDSTIVSRSLTGIVTDAAGQPVKGATVAVKGTNNGAITDTAGKFTLSNVKEKGTLIITFVGYKKKEVLVTGKSIQVQLDLMIGALDEAVVLANGTISKRLSTGNIAAVKAKDIEKQPVSNPLLALQGRVPGLFIEQATGLPGTGVTVRIQGQNSLLMGNDPFYVVDGVPFLSRLPYTLSSIQGGSGGNAPDMAGTQAGAGNPLDYINPADIESIVVLKDADATAIYGSRASNGVVVITTKRGAPGPIKCNLTIENGWGNITRKLKLLNTSQYLGLRANAYRNDGLPVPNPSMSPVQDNLDLTWYDPNRNTNWQDVLIGNTAHYLNMNTSVSGEKGNTQYLVSAGYRRQTTVFPGDLFDRKASFHFNLNSRSANQKFSILLTGNYLRGDNFLIAKDLTKNAVSLVPHAPALYEQDGTTLNWELLPNGDAGWSNPLAYLNQQYRNSTTNLVANTVVSYELLPGLNMLSSFGYNTLGARETLIIPLSSYTPQERPFQQSESLASSAEVNTWIIEPQLHFSKTFGKGVLTAMIRSTFQENTVNRIAIKAEGFSTELLLNNIAAAANSNGSNSTSVYKYNATYGRLHYNWNNRYIVALSGRREGSSRFAKANRFHNFGSAAAAWIFSNEDWLKQRSRFISFGKLKASYGTTGNDGINDWQHQGFYKMVSSPLNYQGATGLEPDRLPNPYLQWEVIRKLSLGLDLGCWADRFLLEINYYRNRSSNQLLDYDVPVVTGFRSIANNFDAIVQNKGWEFDLNTVNVATDKFRWSTHVNLTIPQNKLVAFAGLENSSYAYDYVVGQPLNIIRVYQFAGVDPETGLNRILDKENKIIPPNVLGQIRDRVVNINLNPRYYGGLRNNFTYGAWELDLFFQFVKQMGPEYRWGDPPGQFYSSSGNQPADVLGAWQKPGDITTIARVSSNFSYAAMVSYMNGIYSSAVYGDASYVRLKNLSFSYNISGVGQHKINARIFLQGQNLLTFTSYKGLDPETKSATSLPPLKVFTLGMSITI